MRSRDWCAAARALSLRCNGAGTGADEGERGGSRATATSGGSGGASGASRSGTTKKGTGGGSKGRSIGSASGTEDAVGGAVGAADAAGVSSGFGGMGGGGSGGSITIDDGPSDGACQTENSMEVDTVTGVCGGAAFVSRDEGFDVFGMRFVPDTRGSDAETRHIHTENQFGKLDARAYLVTTVGAASSTPRGERTSVGEAPPFAFPTTEPLPIAVLDQVTGQKHQSRPLNSLSIDLQFATASWSGDSYTFTRISTSTMTTQIRRFDPPTARLSPVLQIPNYGVIGAGVSTCAPLL